LTSKAKLLVVDDDSQFLSGLCLRLKASGFDVRPAHDGMQAVAISRRERPDLIILDIGLPGGDGYVVLERLKSMHTLMLTPIIVLSGKDRHMHEERSLKAGANAYFEKPVDNDALLAAIRSLLAQEATG
jgi:DNA-binding response OmpR family regulator